MGAVDDPAPSDDIIQSGKEFFEKSDLDTPAKAVGIKEEDLDFSSLSGPPNKAFARRTIAEISRVSKVKAQASASVLTAAQAPSLSATTPLNLAVQGMLDVLGTETCSGECICPRGQNS